MAVNTTMDHPSSEPLAWLTVGVRARDTGTGRIGVAQLFGDDLGEINAARPIRRPTRVLLRPLGTGQPWWVPVTDLDRPGQDAR